MLKQDWILLGILVVILCLGATVIGTNLPRQVEGPPEYFVLAGKARSKACTLSSIIRIKIGADTGKPENYECYTPEGWKRVEVGK